MRRIVPSTCISALLLLAVGICQAQTPQAKPLLTVSFSGYDRLMTDIGYIGKLSGNAEMGKGLEGMLTMMTQGKGLAGLDKSRPWGAIVSTDGKAFQVAGFLPVSDLKALMGVLAGLDIEAEEGDDGVWTVSTPGPQILVKQQGQWALIVQKADDFANVPADPMKAFDGLDKKYDLAVKAVVKNIPPMFRQMALSQMAMGMDAPRMPGEPAEQYAMRKKMAENALKQVATLLNEMDEILVGLSVDESSKTATLDIEMTAIEGTKTAEQFAQMASAKSSFSGVNIPGAAVVANWAGSLTDADVAQAKSYLATFRENTAKELKKQNLPEDQLKLAKQIIDDLMDVATKTIENKKSDGGLVLLLDPEAVTLVAGSVIAEGAKLESALKTLAAEVAKDSPELAGLLKLNAETHDGVRFHVLNIPVPPGPDKDIVPLVGKTLEVVVGIGDDKVYVAAGRNAIATLKKVMDNSKNGADIPPLSLSISAIPIAKFVAAVADDMQAKMMAQMVAKTLEASGGKDHLKITSTPIPNGVKTQLVIEEGLLKMIATVSQMMGGMGGGGAPAEAGEATPF